MQRLRNTSNLPKYPLAVSCRDSRAWFRWWYPRAIEMRYIPWHFNTVI